MARKKASDGVQATIERLTGEIACPPYLRDALNKYWRHDRLTGGQGRRRAANDDATLNQLADVDLDNLVHNLLDLDALFLGDTGKVIDVVTGVMDMHDLDEELASIEGVMQRRMEIYRHWLDRMASVRATLAQPGLDLRTERLEDRLSTGGREAARTIPSFALHALHLQEASEAKGGAPSAADYVERADAYLALGDLASADRNACLAVGQDSSCARGWFIRVVVALRRRQEATRAYRRKVIEAQEFAEPASAHERWAMDLADEAAGNAQDQHQTLLMILPQAIVHWPRTAKRHDHAALWKQVRSLFIDSMFAIVAHDTQRFGTSQQWARVNGLEPEWALERVKHPYAFSSGLTEKPPFTTEEALAIGDLLAEYDAHPRNFFEFFDNERIGIEFRLFHLRHVLGMDGGDAHWERLQVAVAESPSRWRVDQLMRDPVAARLWQAHYCHRRGATALMDTCAQWLREIEDIDKGRLRFQVLRQYAYLYHHQFARREFGACGLVAENAVALFDGALSLGEWFGHEVHPYDDSIGMPLSHRRYWEYLAAIAAVVQRREGAALSVQAEAILANEGHWRALFTDEATWFWTASEEYEEGGGEDWPEPPYGIDLRQSDSWTSEGAAHAVPAATPPEPVSLPPDCRS